ncbi:MAG: sigma-70 family RNA polymerase sigma factor [Candidatus Poribacteria bacterium]|nr:sigma-70 family RNA polymerase sigma factor [Candidatus Poribacteria bacterium]
MKLRCRSEGMKCPSYTHEGVFKATDETLSRFESDLNRCANCTAYATPALPSIQEDLLQIARITLWKKGPAFDPNHQRKASFRSYILPWICGALTREKKKEGQQCWGFTSVCYQEGASQENSEAHPDKQEGVFAGADEKTDFEDTLIYEMWNADFEKALPQLLQCLTKREQQVFICIRQNLKQVDIAERLTLSKPRINQLLKQVESKLRRESQNLGLIE